MFKLFSLLFRFYDDADGTGSSEGLLDTITLLNEDDDKEVIDLDDESKSKKSKSVKDDKDDVDDKNKKDKDDKDKDDEEEPEIDELDELEKELKIKSSKDEDDDDDDLLTTPVTRREILAKYPRLFKDFPYLEKAYFRDRDFTEIFPTISDAKNAAKANETLNGFSSDVLSGNIENVLATAKQTNPQAFNKIVDNYLVALSKVDQGAYHHVMGNNIKFTIMAMVQEGRKSNNEALQSAAQVLNQFVFGSSEFAPPARLSRDPNPDDVNRNNQINQREQAFLQNRFQTVNQDMNSRVNNTLINTINANIDPKDSMSDYVKKTATRDALESVNVLISKDLRFRAIVDKLWENAYSDNFSNDSVDKIRKAFISKAKTLLPSVIKKARSEALRGMGVRIKKDSDEIEDDSSSSKKSPITPGRPHSPNKSGKSNDAKGIPAGMSTYDFLNQD